MLKTKTLRFSLITSLTMALFACESTVTPQWLSSSETDVVCDYAQVTHPNATFTNTETTIAMAQKELLSRGFTQPQLALIKQRKIEKGMSKTALRCSWGKPLRVNTSNNAYGTTAQWVFPDQYVYLKDDIVDGWQSFN